MQKGKCFALMATLFFAMSALATAGAAAAQQESESEHHGQGYVFLAPGGVFEGGHHL